MTCLPYTAFSSILPGRSVRSSTLSHWVAPAAMTPLLGKKLTRGSPLYCTRNAPVVECMYIHMNAISSGDLGHAHLYADFF